MASLAFHDLVSRLRHRGLARFVAARHAEFVEHVELVARTSGRDPATCGAAALWSLLATTGSVLAKRDALLEFVGGRLDEAPGHRGPPHWSAARLARAGVLVQGDRGDRGIAGTFVAMSCDLDQVLEIFEHLGASCVVYTDRAWQLTTPEVNVYTTRRRCAPIPDPFRVRPGLRDRYVAVDFVARGVQPGRLADALAPLVVLPHSYTP